MGTFLPAAVALLRLATAADDRTDAQLLETNRDKFDLVAGALLEREELDRDDVAKLLGVRPGS